ncbi:MAG: DNA-3-methyladenine glycosylase I [Gammaproteobacteria bacterium]|nr:DNA-3-methyladenine glycosylase I [Gammaproteobacteria bacterium]
MPPVTESPTARLHPDGRRRCAWCSEDRLYVDYHDQEWGVALHDERRLFEMLCLEGAQAGLSWITILRKREHYRRAFDGFDPQRIAVYGRRERARLLRDPGIVRNRLKIEAFIANARAYLDLREAGGTLDGLLWGFTGGRVLRRRPWRLRELATSTAESEAMSRELKARGFRFVGSTICHALMQAIGILDEHQRNCWRAHRPHDRT